MIRTLRYGARAIEGEKTRILQGALDAIRPGRFAAAFDLDGTLLSNKPRQARIVRDFGRERGVEALARCGPEMIVSWDLRDTMRLSGLAAGQIETLYEDLRRYWLDRFFTSEYCKEDEPVRGARDYLGRFVQRGAHVLYVTGRHSGMEAGTLAAFERAGFPLPEIVAPAAPASAATVQLWLKPKLADDDDRWLLITVFEGWAKSEMYLQDLKAGTAPVEVTTGKEFLYSGEILGGKLYILTNEDAPRYRVLVVDAANPSRENWKEIIPQSDAVLQNANIGRLMHAT